MSICESLLTFAIKKTCEQDFRVVPPEMRELCWDKMHAAWSQHLQDVDCAHLRCIKAIVLQENEGSNEVAIRAKDPQIRKKLHCFCEALGLKHGSVGNGKKRHMIVSVPSNTSPWRFQFTQNEPQKRKKKRKRNKETQWLTRDDNGEVVTCDACDLEWTPQRELYFSGYWPGVYCEACLMVKELTYRDIALIHDHVHYDEDKLDEPLWVHKVEALGDM